MKIKNGDLPAMPTNIDAQTLGCVGRMANMEDYYRQQAGLTKREQFAMAAMQGLLSNATLKPHIGMAGFDAKNISECAVIMANALLAELERTK